MIDWYKKHKDAGKPAGVVDEKVPKTERNRSKTHDWAKIQADHVEKYDRGVAQILFVKHLLIYSSISVTGILC